MMPFCRAFLAQALTGPNVALEVLTIANLENAVSADSAAVLGSGQN